MAASALPVVAFRRRQHGEKRQGPIASRPGDLAQPHQGNPAQTAGLDQVAPAGTHRIAVDAQGFDFRAAAPFQGFVDAEDQRTIALIQVEDQQSQQDACRLAGRPHRPIEHLMITGVVAVVAQSHDTVRRCHGALAGSQYRADQQDLGFPPGRGCETAWRRDGVRVTIALGRVSIAWPFSRRVRPDYPVLMIHLTFVQRSRLGRPLR